MQAPDINALGIVGVLAFLLIFVLFQSLLVGLAAWIVGLPERSVGKALSAGGGVVVAIIISQVLASMLHPFLALPLAVLIPSWVIQRVYGSTIGRALMAYVLSVLIVVIIFMLMGPQQVPVSS